MDQQQNVSPMEVIQGFFKMEQQQKVERYKILNRFVKKNQIVFAGSSLMEQFPINELQQDFGISQIIYNRGIGGYTTMDMMKVLDTMIFELEPSKLFINIGSNDFNLPEYSVEYLLENYRQILLQIQKELPETTIFVMAYYPVNGAYDFQQPYARDMLKVRTNERIQEANEAIHIMSQELGIHFIDMNRNLKDAEGNLKAEFSIEGVHMYANGYEAILGDLIPYLSE